MDRTDAKTPDGFDVFLNVLFRLFFFVLGFGTLSFLWVPFVVAPLVNRKLRKMPDFGGEIRQIRIHVLNASISIRGLCISKKNGLIPVAFCTLDHMHIALRVYERKLLLDVGVRSLGINLVKGLHEHDSQLNLNKAWLNFARKMMVLNINRLEVENGSTHFRTYYTEPHIDVFMDNIQIVMTDLDIRASHRDPLPADVRMTAHMHGGEFRLDGTLHPRNPIPTFDLNAELHELQLVEINQVLLVYAGIDVSRGVFSMSSELAAKDRKISGYVKPVVKDLKLFNWKSDRRDSFKKIVKELFIDGLVGIFKNHRSQQVATKVLIDGEISDVNVNVWKAIGCVLCNAFVQSLLPQVENSVTIDSVGQAGGNSCLGKTETPTEKGNGLLPAL